MMLKLKLQYFGHLTRRVDSLEKTLMLGGIGGRRRRGRQRMRWLDGITDSMDVSLWTPGVGDGKGGLTCCDSWGRKESDTTERLNWTELVHVIFKCRKPQQREDLKGSWEEWGEHKTVEPEIRTLSLSSHFHPTFPAPPRYWPVVLHQAHLTFK